MTEVPQIFDRALARQRLIRAERRGPATFLVERAADDLVERMETIKRAFPYVLDFGTPGAEAAAAMGTHAGVETVGIIDQGTGLRDLEEVELAPGSCDCIVSLYALQTINDLPGLLLRIRRALRPDGVFIGALAGGSTLAELRIALIDAEMETVGGASARVAPFADVRTMGQLLQRAGFALPVVDSETITVRYGTALDLMVDLRDMGATNVLVDRSRKPLRRATLMRAAEIYASRFADPDGRIRATFETIWLSGWAPHESQPRPLKPGSATTRLEDALKAVQTRDGNDKP